MRTNISSWGQHLRGPHHLTRLTRHQSLSAQMSVNCHGLAYGFGRSYGDACLNLQGTLWETTQLDRFIAFDPNTGRLVCEAGVSLGQIQRTFIPQGWMLPVTPGTQWVTLGGAIANDVHGKNHHRMGSFGHHVLKLTLLRTDGQMIECGPDNNQPWFQATIGGLGLTGLITQAELQLRPISGPFLEHETLAFHSLEEWYALIQDAHQNWEHTVTWVNGLSSRPIRGLLMRANHTTTSLNHSMSSKRTITLPNVPVCLINRAGIRLFNQLYLIAHQYGRQTTLIDYQTYFYPLDRIQHWNRLYGPNGFFQYQAVFPISTAQEAIIDIQKTMIKTKQIAALVTLKTFGHHAPAGMLSFPRYGITLALDFPNQGKITEHLFKQFDQIVQAHHGAIYLAKDARMSKEVFERSYPNFNAFLEYRDPGISSSLSRRLLGV